MSYEFFTSRIARLFSSIVNEKIHDELDEQIFNIYKLLKKKKYTAKKKLVFNDLDNEAWIDTVYGNKEAVFLSDQNCQFVIILYEVSDSRHKFVAYRFYHDYTECNDLTEKITTAEAIEYATVYMDYSDNINGRDYVNRPDMKYFKTTDIEEEYQLFEPLLTIDRMILGKNEEGNELTKELLKSGLKPDNQNGIGSLPAFSSLILDIEFTEEELERRTRKKR